MARSEKRPEDPDVAELWSLGYVEAMSWGRELARCHRWLQRVDMFTQFQSSAGPTALHLAMQEVVRRAYRAFVNEPDERVAASEAMAAAAVIGLVTERRELYDSREPGEKRMARAPKRRDRLDIALDWFHKPIKENITFIRTYEETCLTTFGDALDRVLNDDEVVTHITSQLESEGLLRSRIFGTSSVRPGQTLGQSLHGTYIERPDLEVEVMSHLTKPDVSVIYLHGDAGTGKTRLAEECASKYAAGERAGPRSFPGLSGLVMGCRGG